MKQAGLRKWHRRLGLALAVFIVLQAGSGLWLTVTEMGSSHGHPETGEHQEAATAEGHGHEAEESSGHGIVGAIHHSEATWVGIYRIALAVGILLQTVLGLGIFAAMKQVSRAS